MTSITKEHIVKRFDGELDHLHHLVLNLGSLARNQLQLAVKTLEDEDPKSAREVISRDQKINALDVLADEEMIQILAKRQPVARDLREVITISKITCDLERVGDEARKIARLTIHLYDNDSSPPNSQILRDIHTMADFVDRMLKKSLKSFDELDMQEALEVLGMDIELDDEFRSCLRTILRSTVLGTGIGMVPGVGQVVAAFVGYSAAKRASKHPERFGTGELEGVAAPEAANNAVNGPTLVPLLTLGIPGDNVTAILLGAFVAHGLRPGPQIFDEQGSLLYAILLSIIAANALFLILGYVLLKPFARAIRLKKSYLVPVILALAFVGTLSTGSSSDLGIMVVAGVCSYVLRKLKFDLAPLIIAFVLAKEIELRLSQSIIYARGDIFYYLFVDRPIASAFLTAGIMWVLWRIIRRTRQRRNEAA